MDAFAELYAGHRDALHRYCQKRSADPGMVEDIVQDVFEKAFAARHQFDGRRDFWPWLASIAARACIDAHRRAVSAATRHDQYGRDTHREPEDVTANAVLHALDRQTLGVAMARLPPRQRAVLGLAAIDGWTYEQIGRQFGWTTTTVKTLIWRARATLRESTGRWAAALGLTRLRWARLHSGLAWLHPASWPWEAFWSPAVSAALTACALAIAATAGPGGPAGLAPTLGRASLGVSEPTTALVQSAPASERATGPRAGDERDRRGGRPAAGLGIADLVSPVPDQTTGGAENIHATSFATSSGQDDDRTIVVAGDLATLNGVVKPRLLVSHDDGETWERRRALGLAPVTKLLLPPAYPRDARILALSTAGLQVSHDDGETFEVLAPVAGAGDAALSPDFNRGDPRILVVAGGRLLQ
ncbi:MAG TPA: sigma-70 family RNA polymerase sigma factor, partial [Acidimicrobiales bacterium]